MPFLDPFEDEAHPVFKKVATLFDELKAFFNRNKSLDYNFVCDQTIGYGGWHQP